MPLIAEYLVLLGRDIGSCNEFKKNPQKAMQDFRLNDDQQGHILNDTPEELGAAIIAEFDQSAAGTKVEVTGVVTSMTTKLNLT